MGRSHYNQPTLSIDWPVAGESSKGRTQSESWAINGLYATVTTPLSSPLLHLYLCQGIHIYCNGFYWHGKYASVFVILVGACILANTQCRGLDIRNVVNSKQAYGKRWCFFSKVSKRAGRAHTYYYSIHIAKTMCICIVIFCFKTGHSNLQGLLQEKK